MRISVAAAVITLFAFCFTIYARDVAFIGLSGDGAPAVEKTFDRLLREHLSVMPDVNAVDYMESQRYKQMINFSDFPTVSRSLVESLERIAADTTLFIWGTVKRYNIRPQRKFIFGAAIRGELTIALTMYSLQSRSYAYAGDVSATTTRTKGFILFGSADKYIHVSALDRAELLEKLEFEVVEQAGRMIKAVVRSEIDKTSEPGPEVEKYKVPSIQDVFTVPSMEAPKVGAGDTATIDTTKANTDTSGSSADSGKIKETKK